MITTFGDTEKLAEPDKGKDGKDTVTFIPVNEQLKALGVTTFVRQSNVINLNFKGGQMVVVQIDPKKLTNTRDAFEKEALRYSDLSKNTISKVLLFLMDVSNGYLQYLLYNKAEELNADGTGNGKESSKLQILTGRNAGAKIAMKLTKKHCQDFFLDNFGQPHVPVKIDKHLEVLPIKGSKFKNWLCQVFYDYTTRGIPKKDTNSKDENQTKVHTVDECFDKESECEKNEEEEEDNSNTLNSESLNNVLRILEAKAVSSKIQRDLYLRVAKETTNNENDVNNGTSILYDLTNEDWQVVRITASRGWNIEYAPVVFRRYSNQKPQVYPSKEYSHNIFDSFIDLTNIKDSEDNTLLFKVYITTLFYPGIQHPALMLYR